MQFFPVLAVDPSVCWKLGNVCQFLLIVFVGQDVYRAVYCGFAIELE